MYLFYINVGKVDINIEGVYPNFIYTNKYFRDFVGLNVISLKTS